MRISANGTSKIPPTLIVSPETDALCMEEEIFGPLLPIRTYKDFDETIDFINCQPATAWRLTTSARTRAKKSLPASHHLGRRLHQRCDLPHAQEDMPFGGVGPLAWALTTALRASRPSVTPKSVYSQSLKFNVAKLAGMLPPYGKTTDKNIKAQIKS